MNPCKYETCSVCSASLPTNFCSCQFLPVVLCARCIGVHILADEFALHQVMPINIMGDWARPDYREEVGSRKRKCEEARTITSKAVADIEGWKKTACEEITRMITDLTSLKGKIDQELNELLTEMIAATDIGLQEAQKSLFLPQPALQTPFGKALFASLPGAVQLISLQTDFASWKSAFDRAIFSMDLRFQLELPGFEPTGLIRTNANIDISRKVNIYLPLPEPVYTEESRKAWDQCSPWALEPDTTPLVRRGPVSDESGNVYMGQWNAENQSHGSGKLYQSDGTLYEGQFKQDEFNGKGRLVSKEGTIWTCEWKNHNSSGFGTRQELSGEIYTGEMKNDKREGYGFTQHADSDTNEAIYSFGKYEGDQLHGLGATLHKSGYMHFGRFHEGKAHGKGLCRGVDKSLYYGDFAEGDMKAGLWLQPNGKVYRGEIQQDMMWGKGKLQEAGEVHEGEWEEGELKGAGEEISERSTTHKKRKPNAP